MKEYELGYMFSIFYFFSSLFMAYEVAVEHCVLQQRELGDVELSPLWTYFPLMSTLCLYYIL